MLVPAPKHVRLVKGSVEWLRRVAPWAFVAIAPVKPAVSRVYYGWVNRHERIPLARWRREHPPDPWGAGSLRAGERTIATPGDAPTADTVPDAAVDTVPDAGVPQPVFPQPGIADTATPLVPSGGADESSPTEIAAFTEPKVDADPVQRPDSSTDQLTAPSNERESGPERAAPASAMAGGHARRTDQELAAEAHAELAATMARARAEAAQRPPFDGDPSQVLLAIGTLGAGGAERQLVTFAAEVARRTGHRASALTMRAMVGADAHHLPTLRASASVQGTLPIDLGPAIRWLQEHGRGWAPLALPHAILTDLVPLLRVIGAARPAVVHAWLDWTCVTAGVAAALLPVRRIVLSTRNVGPHHFPRFYWPFFRDLYALLLTDPRVVLVNNSHAGARDYASWLDVAPERFHVVRNGLDLNAFSHPGPDAVAALRRELRLTADDRIVAGVFRLADEKAPEVFLRAAERIVAAAPNAIIVHAGDGPSAADVQRLVHASPARERIRLLGRRHDVPTIMSAAEIVLLASWQEGTPNVLIEAQELGCPVVSTDAGGAAETFEHDVTGLLCKVGDADALADSALRLLRDETLRRSMAAAGPVLVRERFAVSRMVEDTLACYS